VLRLIELRSAAWQCTWPISGLSMSTLVFMVERIFPHLTSSGSAGIATPPSFNQTIVAFSFYCMQDVSKQQSKISVSVSALSF
jgi:hypothetical protein